MFLAVRDCAALSAIAVRPLSWRGELDEDDANRSIMENGSEGLRNSVI